MLKPKNDTGPTIASEQTLVAEAERIDSAAAQQSESNPLDQVLGEDDPAAAAATPPVADPAIQESLLMLVKGGTTACQLKLHWSDPGDEWRNQVAHLGAALIARYLPALLSSQPELVSLIVLIGAYVVPNVIANATKETSAGSGDTRPAGFRQDHFIEPEIVRRNPAFAGATAG